MKKQFLVFIAMLLAIASNASATDKLSIEDFELLPGETKTVSLLLDNPDVAYRDLQFDLYLPSGITVVQDEYDEFLVTKGSRCTNKHAVAFSYKDGHYVCMLYSTGKQPLTDNSGEVLSITLKADENAATGAKTGYFRNVKLSKTDATGPTYSEFAFSLTIKNAEEPVTVTANNLTMVYGDIVPALTYTTTGAELNGTPVLSTTATQTSAVGTYPITVTQGTVTNTEATYVNGTLTITKAPLTVGVQNVTISEGDAIPTFTLTYSGWKNGDTEANAFIVQPTATTTATANSTAGTYDITVSGGTAQNYALTYQKGTLTIQENEPYKVGDDITSLATATWEGKTGDYRGLANLSVERYTAGTPNDVGDILTQTVSGLRNGTYRVQLEAAASFTPGRGFECPTGDGLSVVFANGTQRNISVVERAWVEEGEQKLVTLTATVTNGRLKYGIKNLALSGNWFVARLKSIVYISTEAQSPQTYAISIASEENGTTTTDVTEDEEGSRIFITAKPDRGYALKSLQVTTTDGQEVEVTGNSFIMPASAVEVTATYITSSSSNIDFADVNVKALCIAKWDTDKDGELSEAEAAAVTHLSKVFFLNEDIMSFNELQYFTGVTSIGESAFRGCSGLTSVTIPNSVTSIEGFAFYGCSGLTSVEIPNSVTSIGESAFQGCSGLISVIIPNSVTAIGNYAFYKCSGLTSIVSEIEEPFTLNSSAFWSIASTCTLIVPAGTRDAYIAAGWTENVFKGGVVEADFNDLPLTRSMFKRWNGFDATAQAVGDGAWDAAELGTTASSGNTVYGTSAVYNTDYADVTGATTLRIVGTAGVELRVMMNRQADDSWTELNPIIGEEGYADVNLSTYEYVHINAIKLDWNSPAGAITAFILNPTQSDLTKAMFHQWTLEEPVEITNPNPYCTLNLFQNENNIYGDPGVSPDNFADLAGWDYLTIAATNGIPRLVFNRIHNPEAEYGTEEWKGSDWLEINSTDNQYVVSAENGIIVYDLKAIREDCNGMVRLHAIKGKWGPATIHAMKLSTVEPATITWRNITVADSIQNGTVTASFPKTVEGAPVTLTATPDEGCELTALTVTYLDGETTRNVEVAEDSTFTMPAADVTVSATFTEPEQPTSLNDSIYIKPFTARVGGDVNIEICLKNEQAATAYVFDLVLPEGITVALNDKGKYMDELSDRHADHTRTFNYKGNNTYGVSTLSGNSEELSGNDGAIRLITLHVADDMAEGAYAITIQNASYSKPDGALVSLPNTTTTVTVEDYILGDVNGNGGVDIGDAVTIVNYLVGKDSSTFVEKAADTNKNGGIDIGDAVTIVNYLVGKTTDLVRPVNKYRNEMEPQ